MKTETIAQANKQHLTHKRLLDASRTLFLKHGYEAIRVIDIVEAAGVSRSTFYMHFAGKDAVLRELVAKVWDKAREMYENFARLPDWSGASLHSWLEQVFKSWEKHADINMFVASTLLSDPNASQIAAREARDVAALLGAREKWRHFTTDEAERRAYILVFLTQRCLGEWATGRWRANRRALIDTMVDT